MHDHIRIPLLRDRHTHPLLYAALHEGINLNEAVGSDPRLQPNELREEAIRRIRAHAQGGTPGWALVQGWNSGRYLLAKKDFDDLPPLVILNLSLHGLIVNDAGRQLLNRSDPEVAANLDDQDWIERNLHRVLNIFAKEGASTERLQRFFRWLLEEHGVIYAEEMLLVDETEISLFEKAGLSKRTRFWAAPEQFDRLPSALQERVHGIKLFADGALGTRTAAIHKCYRDARGSGMLIYERDELENLIERYLGFGKPIVVHAIGDRAVDQIIAVWETVGPTGGSKLRIDHAQLITQSAAGRAKELGIQLCMQPNFSDDSIHYADRLPAHYAERNNPLRMLIDEAGYVPGEDLFFGSDGMPHGFREALQQSLFPRYPGQRLTSEEFVAGYCEADRAAGYIDVAIDADNANVTGRVVLL